MSNLQCTMWATTLTFHPEVKLANQQRGDILSQSRLFMLACRPTYVSCQDKLWKRAVFCL